MKDDLPVVVYITQRLSKIRGKKALQKIVYFVKEFGVPMTYSFRWWFFGPFSKELYDDLDFLIADNVLSYDWTSHEITFRILNFLKKQKPKFREDQIKDMWNRLKSNNLLEKAQ